MMTQQVTFQLPPHGTATLSLPEVLTSDAFARLDAAIGEALRERRLDGSGDAFADPGAVEFDSWLVERHGQGSAA